MLTYHILPDDASRNNPTVLTRSVIIPDDGNNKQCNEIRLMGSEHAISMQKKYPRTRKSPRINDKLWPQDKKMEEKKNNPPQNARKEETNQNLKKGHSTNKNITNIDTEDKLPHSDKKEENNNNNKMKTLHLKKTLNTKQEVSHPLKREEKKQ